MKSLRVILLTLFTGLLSIAVIAQGADCPVIVQTALDSLDETCVETGRNEACYGNTLIHLQTQADAEMDSFDNPGDTIALSDIEKMTLTPLNEEAQTWGMALMKLQANIPDTVPGQNVTFLLFGDVEIDNAVLDGESGFTPMQAFYFKSGVGDAGCEEAPENGLLIQTPSGIEEVFLNVNGANISLGSTAFLQAGANDDNEDEFELSISVLEGQGMIESFGEIRPIPAGSQVRVETDRNFNVIASPDNPVPYKFERYGQLPIRVLERQFDIQPPLTEGQLAEYLEDFNARQALIGLRQIGAPRDLIITQQNITNALSTDVTIRFSDTISITIPANSEQTVAVPRGRYAVEICALECIIIDEATIMRDRRRTVDEGTFSPND
jgi:hypothetical protein